MVCKDEVVSAVIGVALTLLNLLATAINLDPLKANNYEVASRQGKHEKVECTVSKDHVSCRCPSFKYDRVCKHSIAVAEKVEILEQHLQFISKSSRKAGPRSALEKANLNKRCAGEEGFN